jgi:hypothetical protein
MPLFGLLVTLLSGGQVSVVDCIEGERFQTQFTRNYGMARKTCNGT